MYGGNKLVSICKDYSILESYNVAVSFGEGLENKEGEGSNPYPLPPKMYHLSRKKPNVIVLFLDRALSSFFPYLLFH